MIKKSDVQPFNNDEIGTYNCESCEKHDVEKAASYVNIDMDFKEENRIGLTMNNIDLFGTDKTYFICQDCYDKLED